MEIPVHSILKYYGSRPIYEGCDANDIIYELLSHDRPCMISRFGRTELKAISFYWEHQFDKEILFPEEIKKECEFNAGIFGINDEVLKSYCQDCISAIPHIDIQAVWNFDLKGEETLLEKLNQKCTLIRLNPLGDGLFKRDFPWTRILKNKKVLIIHPFVSTMEKQYRTARAKIYKNPLILPDFDIHFLKSVFIYGNYSNYPKHKFQDWYDALNWMKKEILAIDFEIALIGCAAYGMPLAAFIKHMGKKAVHMGGSLQLLFGIRGERWEKAYGNDYKDVFNDSWVRPSEEETPSDLTQFCLTEKYKAYW